MPSPFPGMDPYLEHPGSWPDLHHRMITAIAISLGPQLLPKYQVLIEKHIYQTSGANSLLLGIPDAVVNKHQATSSTQTNVAVSSPPTEAIKVTLPITEEIRQGHLEIREIATSEVVTAIEILSPVNKRPGKGRTKYETKRQKILNSFTHLVEIDLLRNWQPMPTVNNSIKSHYRILVSRTEQRPQADLYAFNLPDSIPAFLLPLRSKDQEPLVNLQELFNEVYDQAGYGFFLDYSRAPVPALSAKETNWLEELLQ